MDQDKLKLSSFHRSVCLVAGALALMLLIVFVAVGHQEREASTANSQSPPDLLRLSGKVLVEGRNAQPVGPFRLTTYRIEELSLTESLTVKIAGKKVRANKAWRVTIKGGPFSVRALPPVIWIDDVPLGYGAENEELSEISVVTFDRTTLRNGATLGLSYGDNKEGRAALPERLNLPATR